VFFGVPPISVFSVDTKSPRWRVAFAIFKTLFHDGVCKCPFSWTIEEGFGTFIFGGCS
jgi:hypothetical protein